MSNLRNSPVALSILGVKGHSQCVLDYDVRGRDWAPAVYGRDVLLTFIIAVSVSVLFSSCLYYITPFNIIPYQSALERFSVLQTEYNFTLLKRY